MIRRTPIFLLNPQIISMSTETIVIAEGCLSVPSEYVLTNYGSDTSVERPLSLEISYTNLCGENEVLKVDGSLGEHEKWLSRCIEERVKTTTYPKQFLFSRTVQAHQYSQTKCWLPTSGRDRETGPQKRNRKLVTVTFEPKATTALPLLSYDSTLHTSLTLC
jgi:hypothetical protein